MKAIVWTEYGSPEVLKLREVERPVPGDDEILVKVVVSNVFPGDCELRRFEVVFPFSLFVRPLVGLRKPRDGAILGQEYAGEVVEAGKNITRFKPGDRVYGAVETITAGSYAEYLLSTGKTLLPMPDNLSFEEAAVVTVGGLNALHFMRVADLAEGGPPRKVLFNGAAGSIGTMAVQIAKSFGAEVTAVDATHKLDKLLEVGADRVIDYTKEDFTKNGELYDVIIDIVGKSAFFPTLRSVKPGGYFILGNPPFRHMLLRLWAGLVSNRNVRFALAGFKMSELERLKRLIENGRVKPVIDKRYALDEAVEAHRYVETGRRIGNVVLEVPSSPD